MNKIRDFIYLDVERIRSLVSQLEEGLVESFSKSLGTESSISGTIKGSALGLVGGEGALDNLWRRESAENKTLHDYVYSKLEKLLIENNLLVESGSEPLGYDAAMEFRGSLTSTTFLLLDAVVEINDFARMKLILGNFNKIADFLAWVQSQNDDQVPTHLSKGRSSSGKKKSGNDMSLDPKLINGLQLLIDNLLGGKLVLRANPFSDGVPVNVVGVLREECLRERLNDLLTKYGSRPVQRWRVFCQVASLDPHDSSHAPLASQADGIGGAFIKMFDAMRSVDHTVQPYRHPDVTVTPIAVYRQ